MEPPATRHDAGGDEGSARPPWRWSNVPLPEPHLATLGVAAGLERRWPCRLGLPRAARLASGLSLVTVGAAVVVAAWAASGRTELARPGRLVVEGPYAHTRNPMYVGWAALHAGTGLWADSGWMLAGLPVALALVHRQVRDEERELGAAFGVVFERYRRAVPRYLPTGDRGTLSIHAMVVRAAACRGPVRRSQHRWQP